MGIPAVPAEAKGSSSTFHVPRIGELGCSDLRCHGGGRASGLEEICPMPVFGRDRQVRLRSIGLEASGELCFRGMSTAGGDGMLC